MANFYIKKLKVLGFDGYVWSVDGDRHPQEGRVYRTYQQARRVLMDLRRNAVAQNDMQAKAPSVRHLHTFTDLSFPIPTPDHIVLHAPTNPSDVG
jgi:hypothetical protein